MAETALPRITVAPKGRAIGDLPRLARRVLVYTGTRELLTALADGTLWP